MYNDANVIKIKHDVLYEVAKLAFAGEVDLGADVAEVVALRDLFLRLVQGVADFLLVDLADDVEG